MLRILTGLRIGLPLLAAILIATPPGIILGAEDAAPAIEEQSDDDSDKPTEEEEKKSFWDRFKDPEDGKLDLTAASEQGSGFFPIAVPFNDPAIGFGLVAAIAYFHPEKEGAAAPEGHSPGPPTSTFGALGGTTNDTWFGGVGHNHKWKQDSIRYIGGIGGGSINLTFYGFGDEETNPDDGVDFNIKITGLVQEVKFRIADSPVFLGTKYALAATDTTFEADVDEDAGDSDIASLSALFDYNTRDTVFTPSDGLHAVVELAWFDEALGSDFNFLKLKTKFRYYWPIPERWILGFRVDFDATGDEAPFYALSFVKLRGVPAFRYLGNYVLTFEIEPRYKIGNRWSVLAFTGAGRASRELSDLIDADRVYGVGTGFRYLLARKLGLGGGFDIARGPEETVGYIIVGSTW